MRDRRYSTAAWRRLRRFVIARAGGLCQVRARIGEFVGQRNLAVTANTYSHVLIDEAEVDCAALLRA
jgi:hypothetical protein